ncbi:FAD-linked sulfhydryl oxidase ALR-like protein [Piromyces finnis]|uniref:Sulfhydryl oxidase n=1 Tax=Piromyces finnis TaxID=1754191 RepID=A0A1Y1V388_9FUNG|nr:FAD-linked sulfhydryl oxidase ALR-like protein [Piromyces finnis]|eukprot:ORX46357.1 FAD-linked sulfhydryl oxidase ALR-like protein [Piromyces finnis]
MSSSEKTDCKVCSSFRAWSKNESKKLNSPTVTSTTKKCRICDVVNFSKNKLQQLFSNKVQSKEIFECPPNAQELGRATWTYLHSVAAYYPEKPTRKQQKDMQSFLRIFSEFYPCKPCAKYLVKEINEHPPQVETKSALSTWVCQLHNEVNARLGKPIFDCSKVDERWKTGPPNGFCD